MLFSDNPHDRQIEKLMSQMPNFKPRGHGIYVYEEKEYSAENCTCRECTDRRKKKRNNRSASPCIEQRIRAGEIPLGEVIKETMMAVAHHAFQSRLKEYIYETEIMYMEFKNEKHQAVFTEAVQGMNQNDKALMSALYLLTADGRLWYTAKKHIRKNEIDLKRIVLRNSTEVSYTLFCCAKDLAIGTKFLSISDLSDTDLIPPMVFGVICNAMAIRRYGLGAIQFNQLSNLNN